MGEHSVKAITTLRERKEFLYHLHNDIEALEQMLKDDVFEKGIQRIGAEQELCIVDKYFRPSTNALKLLEKINDPHFTTEIALFNLEINLDPLELKGNCFSAMENDLNTLVNKADELAHTIDDNNILMTGILPTLRKRDLVFENITPYKRYKVLNEVLKNIRGDDFFLKIKGVDEIILKHSSILFEACNTSFQTHLQIPVADLVDRYNWSQAIAGPVLSICANSPLLIGRELWSETRIALFQQSVDIRNVSYLLREQKPRVSFGSDWIRESIIEMYRDDVVRYTPLLTTDTMEDAQEMLKKGKIPKLQAIQVHNGTVYRWNRLCYGQTNGVPHVRIENRYLPSGPTIKDEVANALFWVGLMQGMPEEFRNLPQRFSFNEIKENFINAARTGINTYFNWFGKGVSAKKLILTKLLNIARDGLEQSGVSNTDIDLYLGIIESRATQSKTGSNWIKKSNTLLKEKMTRDIANATLTAHMYRNQKSGKPVHEWEAAGYNDVLKLDLSITKLEKYMTTEVFVVNEDDLVELVAKVMEWKNVNHVPVVNRENKVTGIITSTNLKQIQGQDQKLIIAKDIMVKEIITAESTTSVEEANRIMLEQGIGCLPVIEMGELVGILTRSDLLKIIESKGPDE
jgi:CBS domain-containing protein